MEHPGYGASGRSAGILVTIMPEPLLGYSLTSLEFYKSLPESERNIWNVKALWITNDEKCTTKLIDTHAKHGLDSEIIDAITARKESGFNMVIREDESYALVHEYIVDIGWSINAMLQEASRLGVDIVTGKVQVKNNEFISPKNEKITGPIIIASGPWSVKLAPLLSEYTLTYRCQLATIEGARPKRVIEDDSLHYYIVPVAPTRSNIGDGSNTIINDPLDGYNPDPEDTYSVIEKYAERNPEAWNAGIRTYWSAPCNTTGDGIPLVDKLPGEPETYIITGFNGAGLTLAPASARRLVDFILHGIKIPEYLRMNSNKKIIDREIPVEPYDPCSH